MRSISSPLLATLALAALPSGLFGLGGPLSARGTATINGVDGPGEWTNAATVTVEFTSGISGGTSMRTFSLMSDDDHLYVSIRLPLFGALDPDDGVGLLVAANLAGTCPTRPTVDEHQVNLDSSGLSHADLHWVGGSECTFEASSLDVDDGGTTEGAGGATDEGSTVFLEVAVPLDTADNSHDLSATVTSTLSVNVVAVACDGTDCGGPAEAAMLFYLEPENVLLFDDGFESRNTLAWDGEAPPLVEPDVFRWTDLDLRDPHVYVSSIGCNDHTAHGAPGFSVNDELAESLVTDSNGDGYLDRTHLTVFRPLDTDAVNGRLDDGAARCAAPSPPASCDWTDPWLLTPGTFTYDALSASGTCLEPLVDTSNPGYSPAISEPAAPCFWAELGEVTIDFFGVELTLHDSRVAAQFVGDPPTSLVSGLSMGFLLESDADATVLPGDLPLVGGQPLSILFPGGTGNCAVHDDRDTWKGQSGWWIYFNFTANPVTFVGR